MTNIPLLDKVKCKDCEWVGRLHEAIGAHQNNTILTDINNRKHYSSEDLYYCPDCWGEDKQSTKGEHRSIVHRDIRC